MPVYTSSIEVTADYPTIKPSLNLNFARSRSLDPRITFTRASTATYVGRDGLVKTAGNDEPRFDHDPETLESLGLLIEESRTNQFSGSDFASGWNTSNSTLVSGISDPAGGTTARKVVATSTDGSATAFFLDDTTILTGTTYTQSIWAKANAFPVSGNAHYVLQIAPSTRFDSRYQNFDLSNGTLGNGDVENATIEAFPDGWYRCSVTQTSISGGTGRMVFAIANSPTDTRLQSTSTGSANNDGIYVWGPQLEVGSFPTSYIPTSGSSVTRARDDASITGESLSSWYNDTEGTIVSTARVDTNRTYTGTFRHIYQFTFSSGNSNDRIGFLMSSNDNPSSDLTNSGAGIFQAANSNYTNNGNPFTAALAVKTDDYAYSVNGLTPLIDTLGNLPPMNFLYIGRVRDNNAAGALNGTISKLSYYPKRLTNAQLQLLTS